MKRLEAWTLNILLAQVHAGIDHEASLWKEWRSSRAQ